MAEKKLRRVKTLSGFIKWAAQFNNGEYLFRGVSKDSYKIEASAYRRLITNKTAARLLKINQELIEKAKSLGHDQKNGQRLSDLELLAELQHFGAATCLIDFSRNALVALWFACQQSSRGKANGKVVSVRSDDPARFKTVTTDLTEKDIDHFFKLDELGKYPLYQWEPKFQNNRIIAQHSVFVFGGTQVDTEAECVIIQSSKQEILKSLDQLSDVTEASMYPDFDGFARLHAHNKPYVEPDARGYLRRGIEIHQRGNLDDAIPYYTKVIELDPTNSSVVAEAYYNRGVAYGQKDNYDRAIVDFDEAIGLNPNHILSHYNRGVVYYKKDNYDRAIVDFEKVIDLNPNYAIAYYSRGVVHDKRGDYDRAIMDLDKVIDLNPNHVNAHSTRGYVYGRQGNYVCAFADCNHAIELDPNNSEAYSARGAVYKLRGDYEYAIEDFTKAIDLNPNYAEAYNNRGNAHKNKGEIESAIADYNKAIELNPDLDEAYHNRGIACGTKDEYDRAIEDFNKVIDLNPNSAVTYYERGVIWSRLEEWEKAKSDLTIAQGKGNKYHRCVS